MTQTSTARKLSKFPIALVLLAIITYMFPRFLLQTLGEANPWTSYFYLYGHGLIFFSVGLWVILKSGACRLGRGWDSFWFKVLIFGFVFFATVHGVWVYLALNMPYKGGV